MPDALANAARDLAILSRTDRAAILAALSREERQTVVAAMHGTLPVSSDAAPLHSTWFEGLTSADYVTPAARAALIAATRSDKPVEPARPGRSLMQAAGGLLAQAGLRR